MSAGCLRILFFLLVGSSINCVFAAEESADMDLVNRNIEWTELPKVDQDDPTVHRGIVYGPDEKPLPGAKIYAASNIVLFELRRAEQVTLDDLGDVRAVTDELGRFEFKAIDLTWLPASGKRKRWEAFLVATKDGLAPSWVKTWGEDRGFRSHWNPHISKDVAIHFANPAALGGTLLSPDGEPLSDANVTLTSINTPRGRDLNKHIEIKRNQKAGFFGYSTNYEETISRPWLIPGIKTQSTTDASGRFRFEGLPEDFVVGLKVTHPDIRTPTFSVAVREMDDVVREASEFSEASVVLRGSGFSYKTTAGVTLRGRVTTNGAGVSGAVVARANHNAANGMTGEKFFTDKDGKFEITGLGPDYHEPGYQLAVIGSFKAPIESKRFTVHAGREDEVKVRSAVPYRLKLTDSAGEPINRKVYSMVVQSKPDTIRNAPTYYYDLAAKVAPGIYEGMAPRGPGAIVVERGSRRDRPVSVEPKAFFAPGRTDWTAAEAQFSYGTEWHIAKPGVRTTDGLMANTNRLCSQLDMAAVLFTNTNDRELLELAATVYQDEPTKVTLVDDSGEPVVGARLRRQLSKYNEEDLPSSLPLHGLHPERAEFIEFFHEERKLIGSARVTLTDQPVEVVMQQVAIITGRIVDHDGMPSSEFGVLVEGAVPPRKFLGNNVRDAGDVKDGTFGLKVTPGESYSGKWMRRGNVNFYPRPLVGEAFAPVTPKAGEVVDLGDLMIP